MNLDGKCLNQEYSNHGHRLEDPEPRYLCLMQWGDLVVGCAKANLPEEYRDQTFKVDNQEGEDFFAKVFEEKSLKFSRWHTIFGHRFVNTNTDGSTPVKAWVSLLLIKPSINIENLQETAQDQLSPQDGLTNIRTKKKWVFCSCPSGKKYFINDVDTEPTCNSTTNDSLCQGGIVTC